MSISNEKSNPNKTSLYFYKANKLFVVCGLPSFIKWQENSAINTTIYTCIQRAISACTFILVAIELASYITQTNLTEKQASMQFILAFTHPIYVVYYLIVEYYKEETCNLIYKLCITLKNIYNDPEVERQMIKKSTIYRGAFMLNYMSAMMSFGISGLIHFLGSDGTFVTAITVWPDVADKRTVANLFRVIVYLVWWIAISRIIAIFVLTIITTGCLSYQFKQVQSYFYNLNDIFKCSDTIGHENCEQMYEDALKVGIQLHADTLWCTRQCQLTFSGIYTAQITINVTVISIVMLQMTTIERTLPQLFEIFCIATSLLTGTGLLMWNAGDVTVEAVLVATAMYSSGWQNCRGKSSQRIRKLLALAISQAQNHVVLRSFGLMEISHQACISILKASYSVFSLLY